MKRYCPACQADLQGSEIPEHQQVMFGATHFMRWVGEYDLNRDMTTHLVCPECGHRESRMKEGK